MKCQNCGAELPDSAKFCDKCGTAVQGSAAAGTFCPKCGEKNETGSKFCGKCGAPLMDTGSPSAGTAYNAHPVQQAQQPVKKKKWPWVVGIGAAVVILLGIIGMNSGIDPVETVKKACLTSFSSTITIEDAFEKRFDNCEWSGTESSISEESYSVFFKGDDLATDTSWEVSFNLQGTGNDHYYVEVDTVSIDGDLEYDPDTIYYLVDYIYTGNLDQLYTDIGMALWNTIFTGF